MSQPRHSDSWHHAPTVGRGSPSDQAPLIEELLETSFYKQIPMKKATRGKIKPPATLEKRNNGLWKTHSSKNRCKPLLFAGL